MLEYYQLWRRSIDHQHPNLRPWEALEVALTMVAPVLEAEEAQLLRLIESASPSPMSAEEEQALATQLAAVGMAPPRPDSPLDLLPGHRYSPEPASMYVLCPAFFIPFLHY